MALVGRRISIRQPSQPQQLLAHLLKNKSRDEMLYMKNNHEKVDIKSLERELTNQYVRYQLALKDGAVGSVLADVIGRIAQLEEKIRQVKGESEAVPYR